MSKENRKRINRLVAALAIALAILVPVGNASEKGTANKAIPSAQTAIEANKISSAVEREDNRATATEKDAAQPSNKSSDHEANYDEYERLTAKLKNVSLLVDAASNDPCCTCPKNIHPAQDSAQLVENIILFALNSIGHQTEFYQKSNVSCYFQGDLTYIIPGKPRIESKELFPGWGKKDFGSLKIDNVLDGYNYSLKIYVDPKDNISGIGSIVLRGIDQDFVTVSVLKKYFPHLRVSHGHLKHDMGSHWKDPDFVYRSPSYTLADTTVFFPLSHQKRKLYVDLRHHQGDGRLTTADNADYLNYSFIFKISIY